MLILLEQILANNGSRSSFDYLLRLVDIVLASVRAAANTAKVADTSAEAAAAFWHLHEHAPVDESTRVGNLKGLRVRKLVYVRQR